MRKLYLNIAFATLIAVLVIVSCNKNELDCQKCKSNENFIEKEYQFASLSNLVFKDYFYRTDQADQNHLMVRPSSINELSTIFKNLGIYDNNNSQIVGLTIYLRKLPHNNSKIEISNISGVLYFEKSNSKLNARAVRFNSTGHKQLISGETYYISTSDIKGFGQVLSSVNEPQIALVLIDFKSVPKPISRQSIFQLQLKKHVSKNNATIDGGSGGSGGSGGGDPHYCEKTTCGSEQEGYCVAQESQQTGEEWWCLSSEPCSKQVLDGLAANTYNQGDKDLQNSSLYEFRDGFLLNSNKGMTYITNYYNLTGKLDLITDPIYSIEAINIIANDILPIVQLLNSNPNSTAVLFNTTTYSRIRNFLLTTKGKLSNQADKDIIDSIIADLDYYNGKSVAFVFNHFNSN